MKSISRITIVHQICWRSRNRGIPTLSNMKWGINIIRRINAARMRTFVRGQLNKLLSPIYCNSNGKRNKRIFPEQRIKYENIYAQRKISQSKEVAPEKFGDLLDTFLIALIYGHNIPPIYILRILRNLLKM